MMFSGQKGAFASCGFNWKWRGESSLSTGLLDDVPPEIELSDYRRLPGSGSESPSGLLNGEGLTSEPIADLDLFFERLYGYYCEKGLWCIIVKWVVELLSLGFTLCFSGFFLLFVDWKGLRNAKCGMDAVESGIKPCDLAKEAFHPHPLVPFTFMTGIIVGYLALFSIYLLFCFLRFFAQLKNTLEVRKFYNNCLRVTDREVQTISWPAVLEKVVQVQQSQKLCIVKDLSAHDIVMRIMRKENYLIGMINKGILSFQVPWWIPGAGPAVKYGAHGRKNHLMLTKTLEWTLNWCILQSMFDRNFCIRSDFMDNPSLLRKRLMVVGVGMLLISPFLVIFMLVYLCLRHAEQFYNHPSTASSRRWSNLSKWIFREFNEVDHLFRHRINSSLPHASGYLKQFPSPIISLVAKFISFVSGGFAAILIMIAFLEESLLEGHIFGRNLFWYAAVFGTVTAISRAAVSDELQVLDPDGAMSLVVQHTHYMPKRWRAKENTDAVRMDFETLFQYTGMMLLEEMTSIFLTPYILIFVVPKRVNDIVRFISDFTVHVEGVGHVCSFSVFNFGSHGNSKYGSPFDAPRNRRSSQGKMEKSFLSFQSAYPSWEPNSQGQQFLNTLWNFREHQTHKENQWLYSPMQARQPTPILRGQFETRNRFLSRDLHHNIGAVPQTAYTQDSLWLTNPDYRTYPYILNWYYVSQPLHAPDNPRPSMVAPESAQEPVDEHWPPPDLAHVVIKVGEDGDVQLDDRRQSHFEASSSTSLFQHQSTDDMHCATESPWWTRAGKGLAESEVGSLKASFQEPSRSLFQKFSHRSYTSDASAEEELEEWGGGANLRNSGSLSRTRFLSDSVHEDINLPFDINPPLSSVSRQPGSNLF
uniref:Autophagy-related protein 9 n=1 Tax=Anthurium amnicola TaxID=1678845 RepID=A0A1D1YB28_9ARAE